MENYTIHIYENIQTKIPFSDDLARRIWGVIFLIILLAILSIWLIDIIKKRNTIQITTLISIIIFLTIILGISIFKPTLLDNVLEQKTNYNSVEVDDKTKYDLVITSNNEYLMLDKKGNNLILKYNNDSKSWYINQTMFKILGETDTAYLIEVNLTNYDFLDSETITKKLLLPKK